MDKRKTQKRNIRIKTAALLIYNVPVIICIYLVTTLMVIWNLPVLMASQKSLFPAKTISSIYKGVTSQLF